eukprot:gene9166-10139_t
MALAMSLRSRKCVFLLSFIVIIAYHYVTTGANRDNNHLFNQRSAAQKYGRQLLLFPERDEDCLPVNSAINEFPKDFFTQEQRLKGAIVVHLLVTFYTFGLLAVVCDDYFVVSLYHICARLDLDNDVAGATFMAIGSSAPTLFISVISIFFTESGGDVGLGTVVGSTIFNTLFIIATCCLATAKIIKLSWYPLLRDSFMYTLGTVALVITIRDRKVHWYEGSVFIVVYALYIVVMYNNKSLERFFTDLVQKYFPGCCDDDDAVANGDETVADISMEVLQLGKKNRDGEDNRGHNADGHHGYFDDHALAKNIGIQTTLKDNSISTSDVSCSTSRKADLSQFEHKQDSPFKVPDGFFAKIGWILGMPVCLLFYITIPPCCKQRWSEWFLVTFLMSVLWMGTLSYLLVWMVCIVGYTYNIPDCVMGMTFLAAGSSIPDVMASVIVARQGEGDMALSNAIGSNVFDMLCLGIPWLMKTTIINPGTVVEIQSQSIMVSALLLIGTMVKNVSSKTYVTPRRPFEKARLDQELKLIGEYGLRNKREVWRVKYALAKIRKRARTLLTLPEKDSRRLFEGNALLRRLVRIGVLDETRMKLDYVLGLRVEDFLERRLQTQVFKLGLAKSIHHARVIIRQRHIRVRKQLVNIPSFVVRLDSQKHIDFSLNSPYGCGRAGRVKRKNMKKGRGGDADEEEED